MSKATKKKYEVKVDGKVIGTRRTARTYTHAIVMVETPAYFRWQAEQADARAASSVELAAEYDEKSRAEHDSVIGIANNGFRTRDVIADDDDPRFNGKPSLVFLKDAARFGTPRNTEGRYSLWSRSEYVDFAKGARLGAERSSASAVALREAADRMEAGELDPKSEVLSYCGRLELAMKRAATERKSLVGADIIIAKVSEVGASKPVAPKPLVEDDAVDVAIEAEVADSKSDVDWNAEIGERVKSAGTPSSSVVVSDIMTTTAIRKDGESDDEWGRRCLEAFAVVWNAVARDVGAPDSVFLSHVDGIRPVFVPEVD